MSANASRTITWQWTDGSIDAVEVAASDGGTLLHGRHGTAEYWVGLDADWQANWVKVLCDVAGGAPLQIHLERNQDGWRHKQGAAIPNSRRAAFPDIACTAATNTLPIRNLGLDVGQAAEIDVLYVPVPGLDPTIARQKYTRHASGYLYENLTSGFSAQLTVDADGWVRDYPGVCTIVEPET